MSVDEKKKKMKHHNNHTKPHFTDTGVFTDPAFQTSKKADTRGRKVCKALPGEVIFSLLQHGGGHWVAAIPHTHA